MAGLGRAGPRLLVPAGTEVGAAERGALGSRNARGNQPDLGGGGEGGEGGEAMARRRAWLGKQADDGVEYCVAARYPFAFPAAMRTQRRDSRFAAVAVAVLPITMRVALDADAVALGGGEKRALSAGGGPRGV